MPNLAVVAGNRKSGRPPKAAPAVEIQRGVPLPPPVAKRTFPFEQMQVGDSFFVEGPLEKWSNSSQIRRAFYSWRNNQCPRPQFTITVRMLPDGVRCWRTM